MQTYIDALEQSLRSSLDLAARMDVDQWSLPTRCPGWDVHDQIAHLIGVEAQLAGDPIPPAVPHAAHVRGRVGAYLERSVAARRDRSGSEMLQELSQVIDRRLAALRQHPIAPDELLLSVVDSRPIRADALLPMRVFDVWAHEQDIRAALGASPSLTSLAAGLTFNTILSLLPRTIAKVDGVINRTIACELTGDRPMRFAIHVDHASRGHLLDHVGRADVTLRMDAAQFVARVCGREVVPAVEVDGDSSLGRRVIASLTLTP